VRQTLPIIREVGLSLLLTEQPGFLDGDNSLTSEILYQRNLLLIEHSHFLPKKDERTDYVALLEHWHSEDSAIAAKLGR
jgi:hypothetical protein